MEGSEYASAILESILDAFYSLNAEWRITYVNGRAEEWWRRSRSDLLGRVFWEEFPQAIGSEAFKAHQEAAATRQPVRIKTVSPILDRWIDLNIFPTATGGLSVYFRDISDSKRAEKTALESEARYHDLAESLPLMVWETDSTGLIQNVNRRWSELTGRPASDAMGLPWLLPVPPDDQRRLEAAWANAVATGGQFECEYRFVALDGNLRWMLTRATPIRNSEGTILRWVGSDMEITELKEAEERTRFLMREVNHRSKNLLAVVQAVAKQTAVNTDPRAFAARFGERLQGLSATQDLLIHNDWKGASLRDLIRSQITHFEDLFDGRILLNGPSVRITASSAQNLGLAFHELATNAGKYGALSSSQGELHITWNIDETAEGRYFEIVWKEMKGPPVTPPRRKGFGYLLITKATEQALHGTVDLAYGTSGLTWTLRAPLSAVEAATFK